MNYPFKIPLWFDLNASLSAQTTLAMVQKETDHKTYWNCSQFIDVTSHL